MSLTKQVLAALQVQLVPILEGPPGVGKTSFVRALGRQQGMKVYVICLSHKMDTEVHGQPVISPKRFEFDNRDYTIVEQAPPLYVMQALKDECGALICYDEFTTISNQGQAPTLSILADRIIGEINMPRDRIALIACSNPPAMAAGGFPLTPPAANRFIHMKFQFSADEFSEKFASYWHHPPVISLLDKTLDESVWSAERAKIGAFLRTNPLEMLKFPEDTAGRSGPWASPRTWDYVSRIQASFRNGDIDDNDARILIQGCVGEGSLMQLFAWLDAANLPDPRDLLDRPSMFVLPDRHDLLFNILTGCAAEAQNRKKRAESEKGPGKRNLADKASQSWLNCWAILEQVIDKQGPKDIVAVTARLLANPDAHPKGTTPPSVVTRVAPILRAAGLDWSRSPTQKA